MKLKPLGDRVVVKPLEEEERTKGGIVLPDTAKEKPQHGEVVDREDDRAPRAERAAEGGAVEHVVAIGPLRHSERVPDRIAQHGREPAAPAEPQQAKLEVDAALERAEEPADVPRRPGLCLDERRDVKPDAHAPPRSPAA